MVPLRSMSARTTISFALIIVLLGSGCTRRMMAKRMGNTLATSGAAFASDNDPELVGEALPFSLKLMESVLEDVPKHRALLLATSKRFTQYTYAYIQEDADEMESRDIEAAERLRDRARLLYLRARDYGLRGLEVKHPGFAGSIRQNPTTAVLTVKSREEAPLLFWTAASWA